MKNTDKSFEEKKGEQQMNSDTQQKLFDYFSKEHDITLNITVAGIF